MIDEQIIQAHRAELAARASSVYRAYDLLAGESSEELRAQVRQLVDTIERQDFEFAEEAQGSLAATLRLGQFAVDACRALNGCLLAPTGRAGSILVLNHFGRWLNELREDLRAAFVQAVETAPQLLQKLGPQAMSSIIAFANSLSDGRQGAALFALLARYASAKPQTIERLFRAAQTLLALPAGDELLVRFERAVPGGEAFNTDGQRLISEIAEMLDTFHRIPETVTATAMDLVLSIATHNSSSADFVARHLRKQAGQMKPELLETYVDDFSSLVRATGPCTIGFATAKLPAMYAKYGSERTRRFVGYAADAGRRYGATAGAWFCELRTQAARSLLTG